MMKKIILQQPHLPGGVPRTQYSITGDGNMAGSTPTKAADAYFGAPLISDASYLGAARQIAPTNWERQQHFKLLQHTHIKARRYPVLSVGTERTFASYGKQAGLAMKRLEEIYAGWSVSKREEIIGIFWESLRTIRERALISGATKLSDLVIRVLNDEKKQVDEVTGLVTQTIRTAQLMDEGRQLTAIEKTIIYNVHYNKFYHNGASRWIKRRPCMQRMHSPDAAEDKTFFEMKSLILHGPLARILTALLAAPAEMKSGRDKVMQIKLRDDPHVVQHAIEIANQLTRYRVLLERNIADRFELLLTSPRSLNANAVRSLHTFFGPHAFDIIWYNSPVSRGINITL